MPHKIRSIKSKKHSNDPINLLQKGESLYDAFLRYRNIFFVIVGLGVFGLIVGIAFWQFSLRAEQKAWALESEASRLYHEDPRLKAAMNKTEIEDENEHYRKALDLFQKVVQEYPRTSAAPIAQFYVGNTYFELKELDSAIQAYEAFLDVYRNRSNLTPLVQAKLAYVYDQSSKEPEALKIFQTVMGNNQAFNQDQAYYEVGRIYEKMDVKKEAIAAYEKAIEKFVDSPWATEAQARLAMLNPEPSPPVSGQSDSSDAVSQGGTNHKGAATTPTVKSEKEPDGKMTVIPANPAGEPSLSDPSPPKEPNAVEQK